MDCFLKSCHHHHKRAKPPRAGIVVYNFLFACCCALVLLPLLGRSQPNHDYHDTDGDDFDVTTEETNATGQFLGSICIDSCDSKLPHVVCDQATRHCECDKKYPVKLGPTRGCAKPVRLGDQCFYGQTCTFTDQNAACIQIHHNAICQCKPGYHSVVVARPTKRIFCSEDLLLLTTDVPTLFGVATGIALFTALICFVLKLFSSARYTRPRHYANANLAPPILFSSDTDTATRDIGHEERSGPDSLTFPSSHFDKDSNGYFTGIPLAVHQQGGRPSSRSSQRSCGTLASGYSRRASSGGSRGILVPASRAGAARAAAILLISCHLTTTNQTTTQMSSNIDDNDDNDENDQERPGTSSPRAGSRRPSLASIHSSASSSRSFSMRRYERENQQREMRQQQIQDSLRLSAGCKDREASAPMPSPKTPMSTDELLPSVSEGEEGYSMPVSGPSNASTKNMVSSGYQGEIGPCTSSDHQ